MKILIINFGTISETIVSSSLNKGILKSYPDAKISWMISDPMCSGIFKFNRKIDNVYFLEENKHIGGVFKIWDPPQKFDKIINLCPEIIPNKKEFIADEYTGFNFSKNSEIMYEILYGDEKSNMNLFQIYYRLANMVWKGESYDLNYYPKTKSKKNRTGISVAHSNLRRYVVDNLLLDSMRKWIIPYKKNIFKHMDEINKCSEIITDDMTTLNLAIYLRKKVHYLETIPLNFNLEMFGSGNMYSVPSSVIVR